MSFSNIIPASTVGRAFYEDLLMTAAEAIRTRCSDNQGTIVAKISSGGVHVLGFINLPEEIRFYGIFFEIITHPTPFFLIEVRKA